MNKFFSIMAVLFCLSFSSCCKDEPESTPSSILIRVESHVPVEVTAYNGSHSTDLMMETIYNDFYFQYYYFRSQDFITCSSIKFKSEEDMDGVAVVYYSFLGASSKLTKEFHGKEYTLVVPSDATCVDVDIHSEGSRSSVGDDTIGFNMSVDTLKRENVNLKF